MPKLEDQPWPAFPADLMSIAIVTATQCEGLILMHEKMFESRLFFVDKLVGDGRAHRALRSAPGAGGRPEPSCAAQRVESPDIRAGMAMLLAALLREGTSTINNVGQIERGYERIDERLDALGARIERVELGDRGVSAAGARCRRHRRRSPGSPRSLGVRRSPPRGRRAASDWARRSPWRTVMARWSALLERLPRRRGAGARVAPARCTARRSLRARPGWDGWLRGQGATDTSRRARASRWP